MAKGAEASIISLRQVALKNRFTIDNVDVAKGQCIHILGPNGAGKSSLLLVMAGLLEPDSGQVLVPLCGGQAYYARPRVASGV